MVKITQGSKDALITLSMVAVLFVPTLFIGCKSEQAKQDERLDAATQQAQKMTSQDLQQKAYEIQQRKGTDPAKMTPEERAVVGQAIVKGLL
jgi:PBP1b-binding outer membrane lipoprotein LpoB